MTSLKDGPGEGGWAVFAGKVVAERDEAHAEIERLRDGVKDALRHGDYDLLVFALRSLLDDTEGGREVARAEKRSALAPDPFL